MEDVAADHVDGSVPTAEQDESGWGEAIDDARGGVRGERAAAPACSIPVTPCGGAADSSADG